LGQSDIVHNYR